MTGSGLNNGVYTIETVSASVITLRNATSLRDETTSAASIASDSTAASGRITTGHDLLIDAASGGQLYSAALAGAISGAKDKGAAGSGSSSAPSGGGSGSGGKLGIGASGDISFNKVEGSADGSVGGIVGVGSTVFTANIFDDVNAVTDDATSATRTRILGGRNLNFDARFNNTSDVTVDGGAGGLYGQGAAESTVKLNSPVAKAALGDYVTVASPQATLNVTTNMVTDLDATSTQTVGGAVTSNNNAARAGLFTGSSLVDLGDAALITVNVLNLDCNSDTSVVSSATGETPITFGGGNKADAETDATLSTTTHISGVGTVINATDRVTINADAVRAFTSARAKATTTGLSENMFSTANNNRVIDADVITDTGSTINTARLDIVAFVPHLGLTPDQLALLTVVNIAVQDDSYFRLAETNAQTATEYVSQGIETVGNAIIDAACWLFGCDPEPAKRTVSKGVRQVLGAANETKYLGTTQVDNTINFNSTVNLGSGTPRPIVEIDATGRVIRLEGTTLFDGVGPVTLNQVLVPGRPVIVNNIVNRGGGSGSMTAEYGRVTGTPTWNFNVAFDTVDIINRSNANVSVGAWIT